MPTRPSLHSSETFRGNRPIKERGDRLYNSTRWRTLSKAFLRREANGLCRACLSLGVVQRSEHVDHIQPHKGKPALFWAEDNWQPLCAKCHGVKTALETRGAQAFPVVKGKPAKEVILVCGFPGSGRLAWIQQQGGQGVGVAVVDPAGIAARYADCPRHEAPPQWAMAARAEVHRQLRDMASDAPKEKLYVVLECPTHGERREWQRRLKADRVVVLVTPQEDAPPALQALAGRWWQRYTRGYGEEEARPSP